MRRFPFFCVFIPRDSFWDGPCSFFWNDVAFDDNVIYIWFYTPHRISRGHSCRVDWVFVIICTEYNFKLPIEMNTTNPTTTITWNDVQSHLEIYHPWKAIPSSKLSDQHISPPSWFAELVWPYLYFYKTNIIYKLHPFRYSLPQSDFRLLVWFQMWTRKGSVNSELIQITRK